MSFSSNWRAMRRFQKLRPAERSIVFYSEGAAYWVHFEPIVDYLVDKLGRTICYVSSSPDDPGLHQGILRILPFCIGEGSVRTMWFSWLQADVMVMTMPDLQSFHIKRSRWRVHYVYVYHSLVSTHMIYRAGAFDHYDTVFCAGPQPA